MVKVIGRFWPLIGVWRDGTLEVYHSGHDQPKWMFTCDEEKAIKKLNDLSSDPLMVFWARVDHPIYTPMPSGSP